VIDTPDMYKEMGDIVVAAEDGGLGFAGLKDGNLHLWSWQAGPHGVAEWVQGRVIKLRMLLPTIEPLTSTDVIGFREDTYTIFISTYVGVFAVMPKSGQVNKVGDRGCYYAIAPYTSFYTPGTWALLLSLTFTVVTLYMFVFLFVLFKFKSDNSLT